MSPAVPARPAAPITGGDAARSAPTGALPGRGAIEVVAPDPIPRRHAELSPQRSTVRSQQSGAPQGPPLQPVGTAVSSGSMSSAGSASPDLGSHGQLLAVLIAAVAAVMWWSRLVTALVTWRSATLIWATERPG
jgi:hypothetical protein